MNINRFKNFVLLGLFISILSTSTQVLVDKYFGVFFARLWGNIDEIYVIILLLITLGSKKKRFVDNYSKGFVVSTIGWGLVGLVGNINHHAPLNSSLLGLFLSYKPLIVFYVFSNIEYEWCDFYKLMKWFAVLFIPISLSYILDLLDPSFRPMIGVKTNGVRMGWRSLGGFFSHQTIGVLYGMVFFIYFKYYAISIKGIINKVSYFFSSFIIFSSVKVKDILGFCLGITIHKFRKIKTIHFVSAAFFFTALFNLYAILLPEHYESYFGQDEEDNKIARVVLGYTSINIAKDYFPWGVGFGQFASPASQQIESSVYSEYGIDKVWGLDYQNNKDFMSDTFWPMILGETGILGLFFYLLMLFFAFWPFLYTYLKDTSNLNVLFPSYLIIIFLVMTLGKPVLMGPPHSLVLWGIAGMFNSLKYKTL